MAKRKKKKNDSTPANMGRISTFLLIGGVGIGFFWLGMFGERRADQQNDQINTGSETAEILSMGETVYQTECAGCHGVNLEGQPDWKQANPDGSFKAPPHDESGHTWHHSDRYLIERIKTGVATLDPVTQKLSNMPAYGDTLTDEEIEAVLAFIKLSWPADIQEIQAERTAADPGP